ncbi:hypothetical protein HAX54_028427 [Datura stramonium]|uniref:Uncharacterized protein n=1 Tax=Datura stramonium TaxID=4076 RepID=A0ABS8V7G5_DATST|nr:hypothetical protein [Datura stramonium]
MEAYHEEADIPFLHIRPYFNEGNKRNPEETDHLVKKEIESTMEEPKFARRSGRRCCPNTVELADQITLLSNAELARLSKDLAILRCDLPSYMVPFVPDDLIFEKPADGGEKFTSLLTAISAYAEGFSADTIIRRALYLWNKLEKQTADTIPQKVVSA